MPAGRCPMPVREIHVTTRTVHCFAIARLMGRPGADRFIDHGMDFLWNAHRDTTHGGYVWGVGGDDRKQAYGHAFVLLAASSAKLVGHPDADRLLADVTEVLGRASGRRRSAPRRRSSAATGRASPAIAARIPTCTSPRRRWPPSRRPASACTSTGPSSIATHIIQRSAPGAGWMVPEHFDENWELVREFSDGDVFRPYGLTPGHSLEWTRLLLQLWELGGRRLAWLPEAARALFAQATGPGWDAERGGFFYTLGWDGKPHHRNRLWWPAAEGVGAAAFLNVIDGDATLRGLVPAHLGLHRRRA